MEMKKTIQRVQPISDQVVTLLRQRIREGTYGPENRLPSESELAAELGVSRATIRSALATLSAERLIVRRQGDGTYINRRFQDTTIHFGAINEFTSMIVASAHVPTIRAIGIDTRACTTEEGTALQVPKGTRVLVLIRLFYSDDRPAIYSINAIPETLVCRQLQKHDLEEPLPEFFKHLCGQEFTYGISELGAEVVPPEIAHYLDVQDYSPLVCMHEVFYNSQDKPLVAAVNFFNNSVFQLKVARSFQ